MIKARWIAAIIVVVIVAASFSFIYVEHNNESKIYPFYLNNTYFNMTINSSLANNDTGFYQPFVSFMETHYSEQSVHYGFGSYTILVTPPLAPPLSTVNLSSLQHGWNLPWYPPTFGIAMVNASVGSPSSLGFLPEEAKVIAPNGTSYDFNMNEFNAVSNWPVLNNTLWSMPIQTGLCYFFMGIGGIPPTNSSMPLQTGQYTLQVTISLYHLQPLYYSDLGSLTFTEPFYNFTD